MRDRRKIDLTSISFDEFVDFFFSHENENWHWEIDDEYLAETFRGYYIRLFRNPEFLLSTRSKAQLEEGFWAMQSPVLNCALPRLLDDTDLPLEARVECIRSMADLFERLFSKESLDSSVQMWWDSLCYDWHCGNRNRAKGGEDKELQDIFFETLTRILFFDPATCQDAALHGLSHLHHPGTPQLIDRYIEEHPNLTQERKAYALAASKFQVL